MSTIEHAFPTVETIVNAVADWIKRRGHAFEAVNELASLAPYEAQQIANDLGLTLQQLQELAAKEPQMPALLKAMLLALKVDATKIAPDVERDLSVVCSFCADTGRCRRELAAGTAKEHFHEYCGNAPLLETLTQVEESCCCGTKPAK